MDSLVMDILIISLVFSLGYSYKDGVVFPAPMDNYTQKTMVNPILVKSTEKLNSVPIKKVILAPIKNDVKLSLPLDSLSDTLYDWEIYLSATEWQWQVRKQGLFTSQVMTGWIRADYDVLVDFEGFANLAEIDPDGLDLEGSEITTWYAINQSSPPPKKSAAWIKAKDFNQADFIIPAPINGKDFNLWMKIEVDNEIRASEYQDVSTITFSLLVVKDWIEPELTWQQRIIK